MVVQTFGRTVCGRGLRRLVFGRQMFRSRPNQALTERGGAMDRWMDGWMDGRVNGTVACRGHWDA